VDFREQQRQVLEVLPDDRFFAPGDAPVVEVLRDRNDGLVVLQQLLVRQLRPVLRGQVQAQGVVEAVDVVRIQSFQRLILQMGGKLVEALDTEQTEQPLVEGELAVVCHGGSSARPSAAMCGRRIGGLFANFWHHNTSNQRLIFKDMSLRRSSRKTSYSGISPSSIDAGMQFATRLARSSSLSVMPPYFFFPPFTCSASSPK